MRFVDDFLLITREAELAREFIVRLNAGIPSFNCSINQAKGRANFKLSEDGNVLFDKDGKGVVCIV